MANNFAGVDDVRHPIARVLGRTLIPVVLHLLMCALPATGRHREAPTPPSRPAAQRRRRRALWLATVGVDIDHRNIHAVGAAR
jgi:3-oxoacyl-(acyl-carrier-protein) synthase